jgi:4-amino-4-deoxy-L-arabinose transferase-like glycosyltransferase
MAARTQTSRVAASTRWRFLAVLAVGIFFLFALLLHKFGVNDEHYFIWSWRRLPARIYWINLPLSLPFFFGQFVSRRPDRSHFFALSLLWLSSLLLMVGFAACETDPPRLNRVAEIIRNPYDTGFFTDARDLKAEGITVRSVLRNYPVILGQLTGHARNKPPGILLFHTAVISLVGADTNGAMVSGLLIGMLGALASAAVYAFIRHFTGDRQAAFTAASFMAICPGLLLFFPMFDQIYPLLTAGLTILWARAIERDRFGNSIALGLLAGLATLTSYLLALLGFFLIGYAAVRRYTIRRILLHAAVALAALAAFYLALWCVTGFNPLATLRRGLSVEHATISQWYAMTGHPARRLPGTIPWDFYSFAIGCAWIGYVLAGYFSLAPSSDPKRRQHLPIAVLCIGQLVFVAVTNLVPGENWRVWLFMMPMLMLPIGLELKTWSFAQRCIVYLMLLVLSLAICQNMVVRQ